MIIRGLNEPKVIMGTTTLVAFCYFAFKAYFPCVRKAYQVNETSFAMKPITDHFYFLLVTVASYSVMVFTAEHLSNISPFMITLLISIRNFLPLRLGFYGWTEEKVFGSDFWGVSSKSIEWGNLQELIFNGFDESLRKRTHFMTYPIVTGSNPK